MPRKGRKDAAPDAKAFPKLPAGQLVDVLQRRGFLDVDEGGLLSLSDRIGMADRRVREWATPGRRILFNTADKALLRLGLAWWDVWTEKNCTPEELALVEYAFTGEGPLAQGSQLALEEAA